MRVMLSCPYSLSVFGGVQGQVLGLAHALRGLGVDARIIAPCDGPPPEPGITTVGPSTRVPSNGSVAPIAAGRPVARRTLEAIRSFGPDVLHLHEPFSPGSNHAALMGTTVPVVGTFHSANPGRNGWYETLRSPLQALLKRLAVRTAVSPEAQRIVELGFGIRCEIVPNGIEIADFAVGDAWPAPTPAILFVGRHEPRKGLAVLLDAFAGLDRDAVLWVVGDGPQTAALRGRGVSRVEWLGRVSDAEKQERLRGATIACFPRSTVNRSGWCCWRRWPPAPRSSRRRSTATGTSRGREWKRRSSRPAMPGACAMSSVSSSTCPTVARSSWPRAALVPPSSRW